MSYVLERVTDSVKESARDTATVTGYVWKAFKLILFPVMLTVAVPNLATFYQTNYFEADARKQSVDDFEFA